MELEDEEGLSALEEGKCDDQEQLEEEEGAVLLVDDEEEPIQPVVVKKKRGKKKKPLVEEVFLPLPEEAVVGFSPEIIEELQASYKILQTIMGISMIQPFLEKPSENLFGMSSYYSIIRKPMWLNEVQRKLLSGEYSGINAFVADIRLILENCYRFWGPTHKFARKALYIEHKLELKISQLTDHLKEKCLDSEFNANEVVVKTENIEYEYPQPENHEKPEEPPRESVAVTLIKGFESKILNRLLESDDPYDNEDVEELNRKENEMLVWEKQYLVNDEDRDLIKSMWQLAEIGTFLKLTYVALNVEEITQYEVERMLLMPKESTTLATLMTSMLSPQVLRAQLDFKAVMPYEIWTFRLKRRIDNWFHFYYGSDEFQAFLDCGVEPAFWTFVYSTNPLDTLGFHEIPFIQRVWIFKSLCNNLMHTDKPIQDCFFNNSTKELRPICIGRDKRTNIYFRIPFFQEIRVYKQACLKENTFDTIYDGNYCDEFLSSLIDSTNNTSFNEERKILEFSPSSKDCLMIADSVDSLAAFTKRLKERKQLGLAKSFSNQLKLVKNDRKSIDGLTALHTQWHEYQIRSPEYFSHILTLWLSADKQKKRRQYFKLDYDGDKNEEVLGKRRCKRSENVDFLCLHDSNDSEGEQSSDYESSDISDWETTYMKKRKKKQESKKRRKRASSESNISEPEQSNEDGGSSLSILGVKSMQDDMFEVEEKPNINEIKIKVENGSEFDGNISANLSYGTPTNSFPNYPPATSLESVESTPSTLPKHVTPSVDIKKEKEEVICISSDEEEEIKKTAVLQNGFPSPNVVPPPSRVVAKPPDPVTPTRKAPLAQIMQPIPVPQPIPIQNVPQPIPVSGMPQPITTPQKKPVPLPKPSPPARRMPLPIPEPSWPQPMVEPAMPQPIAAPRPQQPWPAPRTPTSVVPPRTRMASPRMRSPLSSPTVRTPSPRPSPLRAALSPNRSPIRNTAVRNLFPQPAAPSVPCVEGVLEIGQKSDGSYGYHVRLPDGGIINMNRQEIDDIRRKNNGVLPVKIEVPLRKKKF